VIFARPAPSASSGEYARIRGTSGVHAIWDRQPYPLGSMRAHGSLLGGIPKRTKPSRAHPRENRESRPSAHLSLDEVTRLSRPRA
jgi:hypothetical protein